MTNDLFNESTGSLNDVFPHKVCINLDRRPDRWEQMRIKFEQHGIRSVRRFSAVDGKNLIIPSTWPATAGAYGCMLSHLQVVREARRLRLRSVLIFEDDVVFHTRLQELFRKYVKGLPANWDMLFFGALHMEDPIEVSDNVCQISQAYSTYAYALQHTVFDEFVQLNSAADAPVDSNNRRLQKTSKCFCFMPHLAWVETVFSDAQDRLANYWYLEHSLVLCGNEIDNLIGSTLLIIAYRSHGKKQSATRNLMFLAHYYREHLPGLATVIVEQDTDPTIDAAILPKTCQYMFLQDGGPFNKGLCFNRGLDNSSQAKRYVIFSDSDIALEHWDIRGNIRMCQRYDVATGFSSFIELSECDTLQLQANRLGTMRWLDITKYSVKRKSNCVGQFCVFNRDVFHALGRWEEERPDEAEVLLSLKAGRHLRVFESPNHAFCLHHD